MKVAYFHRFDLLLPNDAVRDCARAGKVDADVEHWAPMIEALNIAVTPEDIRAELGEYGAWDTEELADNSMNWQRITWVAAWDIREGDES